MNDIFNKIRKCWSIETCYPNDRKKWSVHLPETGHCVITALLIQDLFGGFIVFNKEYHHYWNILPNDGEIDLTRKQFSGVEQMRIDGYRPREYFMSNDDTAQRYLVLKNKFNRLE
jgi:hypothetical protein